MSKLLVMRSKQNPIQSYGLDGIPQFRAVPSEYKEYDHTATQKGGASVTLPSFSTESKIQFTGSLDVGLIQDIIMSFKITNSAARTCTFPNQYGIFKYIKVRLNNEEIDFLKNPDEIWARQNIYWRWNQRDLYGLQQLSLNQTTSALTGLVVAASGDTHVNLSLLPILPYLDQMHTKYAEIVIEFGMQDNDSTTANVGSFCVSSDVTNAYTTALTIDNLKFQTIVNLTHDPRLTGFDFKDYNPIIHKHQAKTYATSFTTTGTDVVNVNFRNDFTEIRGLCGCWAYVESPSLRTAYNDTDACVKLSLPEVLGVVLKYDTNVRLDHSAVTSDLVKRRRFANMVQTSEFSVPFRPEVLASDNSNKYFINVCYIPFTNIKLEEEHEVLLSGVNSKNTNIELQIVCCSSVHASSILHVIPHYLESFKIDAKTRQCTVNTDVLNVA